MPPCYSDGGIRKRIVPTPSSPRKKSTSDDCGRDLPLGAFLRTDVVETLREFDHDDLGDGDFNVYYVDRTSGELEPFACVRDSSIPGAGKGVFACKDMTCGECVGRYVGEVVGWKGCEADLPDEPYLLSLLVAKTCEREWHVVVRGDRPPQDREGQCDRLGIRRPALRNEYPSIGGWPGMFAHLMNDAAGSNDFVDHGLVNNCSVSEFGHVWATTDIKGSTFDRVKPHSELLWPYGKEYWDRPERG